MARRRDEGPDEFGNIDDPSDFNWDAPTPRDNYDDPSQLPNLGVTDPQARAGAQADPNSQEELDRLNKIYGPGGTASNKPSDNATWNPQTESWDTPSSGGGSQTAPTGGNLRDPSYAASFVQYWSTQPGANPSLARDPNYWIGKITSGELGDENSIIQYFMRPEGAPAGSGGGGGNPSSSGGGANNNKLRDLLLQMINSRAAPNQNRDALYSRLNMLMDKYSQPVDANDPEIARSSDAYQGDVQRSLAGFREQAAERAHAEGVGTGAFDSQIGNAQQAGGRATAKFTTDAIGHERDARRAALSGALGQTIGLLGESDNNAQSGFASALSALLGQQGVDNQDSQFYDKLTTDMSSHANDLDTILQELLLGR